MADPLYVPSFFGGDDASALTYEQLLMRRKIAAALAQRQRGFPKNVGEGLTYLGESIGDRLELMRLAQAEKQARAGSVQRQAALNAASGYVPGIGGGAAPAVAPSPRAYTPPVPTPAGPPPPTAAAPDVAPPSSQMISGSAGIPDASRFAPGGLTAGPPPMEDTPYSRAVPGATSMDLGPVYPEPPEEGWPQSDPDTMMSGVRQRARSMQPQLPTPDAASFGGPTPGAEPKPPPEPAAAPAEPIDPRGPPEWQQMNADRIRAGQKPLPVPPAERMQPGYTPPGAPPTNYGDPGAGLAPAPRSEGSGVDAYKQASARLESGGRYDLLGPTVRTGGGLHRAYGKYQVMDFNVGPWTEKYLGQRMSPEEFLRSPDAQEKVYEGEFGRLVDKYGPEAASRAWIGGEGGMNYLGRRAISASGKPIGLSVGEYGSRFASSLGEGGQGAVARAPIDPGAPVDPAAPRMAAGQGAPSAPPTARDVNTDLLLAEATGMAGPGPDEAPAPQLASYAPPTSATDAPALGMPMGNLPDMGDTTQARRGAIRGAMPQPPMTPLIPAPPPGASPTLPGGSGAGAEPGPVRVAQAPPQMLGGSPGIPDARMFAPAPLGRAFPGGAAPGGPIAPAPSARAPITPAPVPGAAAPSSRPSAEPLPGAFEQTYADPGAPPVREQPPPLSQRQLEALRVLRNPFSMPDDKEAAKQLFELDEKERVRLEQQMENDFRSKRETWEKNVAEKTKFDRERQDRALEQFKKRTEIEKTRQEMAKPTEHIIEGQIHQAKPGEPYAVAPGSPGKSEKLTEKQANNLMFFQRASVLNGQVGEASVLAGLQDTRTGKVPIAGNYLVTPEYQRAKSAGEAFVYSVLRPESGAVLGKDEIENNFRIYFPVPGDGEAVIADKALRRRLAIQSLYDSLGDAKPVADRFVTERASRKASEPEGTMQRNQATGKTRRVIGGHWEYD